MPQTPPADDAASHDWPRPISATDRARGRWFQFRLGTMMLVLTVFVVWLGWQMNRMHRHDAAMSSIRQLGGQVRTESKGLVWLSRISVLRRVVVTEAVVEIHFLGPKIADEDIEGLVDVVRHLRSVEAIHFVESRVSDAGVDRLRRAFPRLSIDRRDLVLEPTRSMERRR